MVVNRDRLTVIHFRPEKYMLRYLIDKLIIKVLLLRFLLRI